MSREWAGKDKTWSWGQSLPRKGEGSRKKTGSVQRPWGREEWFTAQLACWYLFGDVARHGELV